MHDRCFSVLGPYKRGKTSFMRRSKVILSITSLSFPVSFQSQHQMCGVHVDASLHCSWCDDSKSLKVSRECECGVQWSPPKLLTSCVLRGRDRRTSENGLSWWHGHRPQHAGNHRLCQLAHPGRSLFLGSPIARSSVGREHALRRSRKSTPWNTCRSS